MSMAHDQVSYGYIPQNCVLSPSPPDATGTKSRFAWQLARRGQSGHHDNTSQQSRLRASHHRNSSLFIPSLPHTTTISFELPLGVLANSLLLLLAVSTYVLKYTLVPTTILKRRPLTETHVF
jgi:hypothetical protein